MRALLLLAMVLCSCRATAPAARLTGPAGAAPARPSAGCFSSQAAPQGERRLSSGGRTRRFRLSLPQAEGPMPLVLNLHGLFEPADVQQWLTGMDTLARARGMAVAYPEGVGSSWNAGTCCGRAQAEQVDDVKFLRDLVRELEGELCLDRNRIYVTGMSNGGIMSYRLACEASDVFAAVAPVAAVEAVPACKPRRPVPVLAFHGTSDHMVSWEGGWFGLGSPQETVQRWRDRNRCAVEPARVAYQHGDARCDAAPGCAADVLLCRFEGGGHTWPGGIEAFFCGHTSSDLDASATLLDFFLDHPMLRD